MIKEFAWRSTLPEGARYRNAVVVRIGVLQPEKSHRYYTLRAEQVDAILYGEQVVRNLADIVTEGPITAEDIQTLRNLVYQLT